MIQFLKVSIKNAVYLMGEKKHIITDDMNYPLFAGTKKIYKLRVFSFSNHNSLELPSQYINLRLQSKSKRWISFTMHLLELFFLFSVLAMTMGPSECAHVVKLEDEMAEGKGLWIADATSSVFCCNGPPNCHFGFLCGPKFAPLNRCCPDGMKCTNSGSGCVKRRIWSSGIHVNVLIII